MRASFYEVPVNAWLFRPAISDVQPTDPAKPEETVRQWCLHELIRAYGISITCLAVEYPIKIARERKPNRIDIVVLRNGTPYIVIECKARSWNAHDAAIGQAINYASLPDVGAEFAVYTNGDVWWVRRRIRDQWVAVPDIPLLCDGKSVQDWRDVLLAVNKVAPVLFWLDKVVPAKTASQYFGALQEFFYGKNEITEGTHKDLLWSADNLLRAVADVANRGYSDGKMAAACDGLNKYWNDRGVTTGFGDRDLWEMAHFAWADLSNLLDGASDMVSLDYQAMRVIQSLLCYLNGMKGRRIQYQDVGATVQAEIRAYIDLALVIRFNAGLPDIQDKIPVGDVRDFCKAAWDRYVRSKRCWPGWDNR